MRRIFTLGMAACLGLAAFAQDTSTWVEGQDVSELLSWRALTAMTEDPENPAWKGFAYPGGSNGYEFGELGTEQDNYGGNHIWGVYANPSWEVYQEFTIPAGMYTLKVQGAYREGGTDITFNNWVDGRAAKSMKLFVEVGDRTYSTSMITMFVTAPTYPDYGEEGDYNPDNHYIHYDAGSWMKDVGFVHPTTGVKYFGPSCHAGATSWIYNGHWDQNSVFFAVPEEMTIRVGVSKQVNQPQDQGWWDNWRIIYEGAFDAEQSEIMILTDKFINEAFEAEQTAEQISENFPSLGGLMYIAIGDLQDRMSDLSTDPDATLAQYEEVYNDLLKAEEDFKLAQTKVEVMSYMVGICESNLKITDFDAEKKAALESAILNAKSVLESGEIEDVQIYLNTAAELSKANVEYIESQELAADGSKDYSLIIACPSLVNQEYTFHKVGEEYQYPDPVENNWFRQGKEYYTDEATGIKYGANDEQVNLNTGVTKGESAGNKMDPEKISDQATWTNNPDATNRWVYTDKWNGWHGGFGANAHYQKIKGYAAFYTDWSASGYDAGYMEFSQIVTDLPDGFYTLEGMIWSNHNDGAQWGSTVNEQMFIENLDGSVLTKVMQPKEGESFWSVYNRSWWQTLTTDMVEIKGGTVKLGFRHNSMAANTGVSLKFWGKDLNFNKLVTDKLTATQDAIAEKLSWAGDIADANAILEGVLLPVSDAEGYTAAMAVIEQCNSFVSTAAAAEEGYKCISKFGELQSGASTQDLQDAITPAFDDALDLGTHEEDRYTMIPAMEELYSAYASYVAAVEKAYNYAEDQALKSLIDEQLSSLKAETSTVAQLDEYASALNAPINKAIFTISGAKDATEAAPVEITDYFIQNPSLEEGPTKGWTLDGGAAPSINTYGRGVAECWNQGAIDVNQTIKDLPAGTYEFRVRACYRSATAVDQNMVNEWKEANGDRAAWTKHNAEFYANDRYEYIASICEGEWTTPSYTEWWNAKEAENNEAVKAAGFMADWDGTICILPGEESILTDLDLIDPTIHNEINLDAPGYPFDTKVGDCYYPASMCGFESVINAHPEVYVNVVRVTVEEGGQIKFGIRKTDSIKEDWVIYDDFQLFYLGSDPATGVAGVNVEGAMQPIYNLAGQRVNSLNKGINIVGGKKIFVK